jgi:hypothetical protein
MARMKHTLGVDKMLEEKKVLLQEKKRDMKVLEAALCKVLKKGVHPRDNHDLLAELVELREHLTEAKVYWDSELRELATLETDMSCALVDLGMNSTCPKLGSSRAGGGGRCGGVAM